MTNLSREFCLKVKEARRAAGLSQSALAAEVGCRQSALSMFESGDGTKLNDEVVAKLAEKFGLEMPSPSPSHQNPVNLPTCQPFNTSSAVQLRRGFCPNPHCPSNIRYEVDGRPFARPDREACDPSGGRFCAVCGEVLEKACPNCGAPIHAGAVCTFCGEPYIALI